MLDTVDQLVSTLTDLVADHPELNQMAQEQALKEMGRTTVPADEEEREQAIYYNIYAMFQLHILSQVMSRLVTIR